MATGACGIDCTICRLHRQGRCGSCGPGPSELAAMKLAVQEQLLGAPCTILACARDRGVFHCMADCDDFPCATFTEGGYPFSQPFLRMQQRRRKEAPATMEKNRQDLPQIHWETLEKMNPAQVCANTGATWNGVDAYDLLFLDTLLRVSLDQRTIVPVEAVNGRLPVHRMGLTVVVYLVHAETVPLAGRWVSEKELKCASFFRGIHSLPVAGIAERFGSDPTAFRREALTRGAAALDEADAAVRLWVLPKVPMILRLWGGDDEMPASVTAAFDASIEAYLPADGIWAMTGAVTAYFAEGVY